MFKKQDVVYVSELSSGIENNCLTGRANDDCSTPIRKRARFKKAAVQLIFLASESFRPRPIFSESKSFNGGAYSTNSIPIDLVTDST
jgi:hypothetical protein